MIAAVLYPLLIPPLRRIVPSAGKGWLAWPLAISCAGCAFVSSRSAFIALAFFAGVFLAIGAGVDRKYDRMAARLFALALQGLAVCFLVSGRFPSLAERMLFLGQMGIAGVFPFCFSGSEYDSGLGEILPYALCVLLSPFVKFSPILPALSVAFHAIGAINEQYVWKFLHRLFAATICLLISFGGTFPGYRGLFVLVFYQLLFLYLSLGAHLSGMEHLTMTEIKGMAHHRPGAALELVLGVLTLGGGPLSVLFPLLGATACLFLFTGHGALALLICTLLATGTALAGRWAIQLSLRSEIPYPAPKARTAKWFAYVVRLLWIVPWIIGLREFYRNF